MKGILLRKVDTMCKAFEAEGYETITWIRPHDHKLFHHSMLIVIKDFTDEDVEQISKKMPEVRILGE